MSDTERYDIIIAGAGLTGAAFALAVSSMRNVEKAMAVERPSKVGASWASNGWGSIMTTFSPPCAAASAKAAPVRQPLSHRQG